MARTLTLTALSGWPLIDCLPLSISHTCLWFGYYYYPHFYQMIKLRDKEVAQSHSWSLNSSTLIPESTPLPILICHLCYGYGWSIHMKKSQGVWGMFLIRALREGMVAPSWNVIDSKKKKKSLWCLLTLFPKVSQDNSIRKWRTATVISLSPAFRTLSTQKPLDFLEFLFRIQ